MSLLAASSLGNKSNKNRARSPSLFVYMTIIEVVCTFNSQSRTSWSPWDIRLPSGQTYHLLPNHNINTWMDFCTLPKWSELLERGDNVLLGWHQHGRVWDQSLVDWNWIIKLYCLHNRVSALKLRKVKTMLRKKVICTTWKPPLFLWCGQREKQSGNNF